MPLTTKAWSQQLIASREATRFSRAGASCSLGLDAEHIVADLHEGEHVDLRGDGCLLGLREVELGVRQGHKGCKLTQKRMCLLASVSYNNQGWASAIFFLTFSALILADVARVLKVVKCEDVLHLSLSVDDRAGAILDSCLDLLAKELLKVVWLLVSQECRQVLSETNRKVRI